MPGGSTPITVVGWPPIRNVCPITFGSPRKECLPALIAQHHHAFRAFLRIAVDKDRGPASAALQATERDWAKRSPRLQCADVRRSERRSLPPAERWQRLRASSQPFSDAGNGGSCPGLITARCVPLFSLAHHDQAIRVAKGEWLEQNRIDHTEDRRQPHRCPARA